jgi:SAM-dependent methyltransferase
MTRFFDPRFRGIAEQADTVHHDLATRTDELMRRADESREAARAEQAETMASLFDLRELMTVDMDAATETATVLGATLSELSSSLDELRATVDERRLVGADVVRLHQAAADLLNYAGGHRGFAAQKGLWFNPPVVLEHTEGDVRVSALNERIVEVPYVLRALRTVPEGARILDVGANESTLALSLAGLGYRVTALDLTPYPFEHPFLKHVASPVEDWETDQQFDAIVCLSTLEHIGIGAYTDAPGEDGQDRAAIARMRELLEPEGILVLTTPLGEEARALETERIYDRATLERLLEGWEIDDFSVELQESELVWRPADDGRISEGRRAVALVTARRTD